MKILIFGGAGFIGSHLVDNLVAKKHTVTIFERVCNKKHWEEYRWDINKNINLFLGDIKDSMSL